MILMSSSPKLYTLQHILYNYLQKASSIKQAMQSGGSVDANMISQAMLNGKTIKYTVAMVSIIPILIVYPFMQRYFEKGIMLGAVKG